MSLFTSAAVTVLPTPDREHWPVRKIERHLRMSWRTVEKYLDAPAQAVAQRKRESKLDPFKATIAE
jgi:hypothetical protein